MGEWTGTVNIENRIVRNAGGVYVLPAFFAWEKETVTGLFSKNKMYCFFESDILHILYANDIISTTGRFRKNKKI